MPDTLKRIKFDSPTHYHFLAFTDMNRDYEDMIPDVVKEWETENRNGKLNKIRAVKRQKRNLRGSEKDIWRGKS